MTDALGKTITLVVTEECNFRCRYCYMVRKNSRHRMTFDMARKAVDFFLTQPVELPSVTWEFLGGEPLLEVELVDQIIGYTMQRAYELDHPWFESQAYGMSSNGSLHGEPAVQRLLDRYGSRLWIGITLDGPEHVHDLERRYPDGRGTHADVVRAIPGWLERNPNGSTKVTISHETLPFLAESILYLFGLGICTVNANVVFENVWQPGDPEVLEEQLDQLSAVLPDGCTCSLFSRSVGNPLPSIPEGRWCGCGRYMTAVDSVGMLYPCVRFMSHSLARRLALSIGDIWTGVDPTSLAPFEAKVPTPDKCLACDVATGCAWCRGFDYDDTGRLDVRATYICEMHKARVRANRRHWARVDGEQDGKDDRQSGTGGARPDPKVAPAQGRPRGAVSVVGEDATGWPLRAVGW